MTSSDNLVPEPQDSILASVNRAIDDQDKAKALTQNPTQAEAIMGEGSSVRPKPSAAGSPSQVNSNQPVHSHPDKAQEGERQPGEQDFSIPLKAVDDIGKATAQDVREALHQVIDPELSIDVVDLGLVYGIEIDELGRAIITMTLTTPACPLTDLIEDQCASVLAGLVEEFRIDWTWTPRWGLHMITPEGREQLAAIGFNLNNMPTYQ